MAVTLIPSFRVSRIILVLLSVGLMVFLYASYANHGTVQLSTQLSLVDGLYKNSTYLMQTPNLNVNTNTSHIVANQKQGVLDINVDIINIIQRNDTGSSGTILQQDSPAPVLKDVEAHPVPSKSNITPKPSNTSSPVKYLDASRGVRTSDLYVPGHSQPNAELCGNNFGENIRLLIIISSAPTHRDARLAIRQTWGHYATRRDVVIVFILGATTSQSIEDSLEAETFMYNDIIRGRFIDSYNNLTLKTISTLEWVDVYCHQVPFLLKTDDDMFINIPKLLSFIDKHRMDKKTIFGRLAKKWKPIRNKKSKYYVSPQQYYPPVFPQFTTGPAYLITCDAVHDIYYKALNQTYLKLEDVFTTGIVAQLVNVRRIHINEFLNRRIAFNACNIRKAISIHMVKSNEQYDLWKKLLDSSTKCK